MAKGQKGIFITDAEFLVLNQAKKNFEVLTGAKFSWGAYLIALAIGSLGTFAIRGYSLRCPNCEESMEIRLVMPTIEPNEVSEAPSPSSSRERTATHKQ
ncbi:hypothetical protein ES703_93173 [subsurface metagenome]